MEIANFFWLGELSIYERKCIQSFVKHNFIVRVWSFNHIDGLPEGVELCDANLIVSNDLLNKATHPSGIINNVSDFHLNSAAVADIFRVNIGGSKIDGWYFDTDCFCLKDQNEFKSLRENKLLVVAHEDPNNKEYINNAVMYLSPNISQLLCDTVQHECVKNDYKFSQWAQIGPNLLSDVIKHKNLQSYVLPYTSFYSIYWTEMDHYSEPSLLQTSIDRTKDSYVIHLWNSQLVSRGIKNKLPPEGSFLDYLFKSLE